MVHAAAVGVPPLELFMALRIGAGGDGAGNILEDEVRLTDPPAQIVLIDAFADTIGAVRMITEVEFVAVQLFASVMVKL